LQPASANPLEERSIVFRRAQASDLEFLRRLCARVFGEYGSYQDYVESWFRDETVATYVAELGAKPAGFFMLAAPREGACELDLIAVAVSPELQSRGVGKALLEKSFDVARESWPGAAAVRLQVAEGNARAQRMFARRGFRMRPERGLYPAGQRALFMVKTLETKEEAE
jgi:ribosomal protein S18 acetylase RimI-like enzyme